jgi:DNA-binding NarL/FixJ family response regulator
MKTTADTKSEASRTTVVLVDDHASLREMLRLILKMEGGYEIVGEAAGGLGALKLCREKRPSVVIVDLTLPELSGTQLIRLLLREAWEPRVLVYSGTLDRHLMQEALAEGPHGFVRKEDSLAELRVALRSVAAGARHISPWAAKLLSSKEHDSLSRLTPQERVVLQMVAEGLQTKEIADALGSSAKTVDHHRQNLRDKLGLHDVASLTRFAIRHQMIVA